MRLSPALLPVLLLLACSSSFDDDRTGSDGGATDGGSSDGGDGGTVSDDLPAVDEDLDTSGCEELYEDPVPGAAVYYLGTFERVSGDEWTGWEEYRLHANAAAREAGGQDCSVFWSVEAVESNPSACATCDLGLSLSAELDPSRTSCSAAIYEGEESFSVGYGIKLDEGAGTTEWVFGETGTELGAGYFIGSPDGSGEAAMNYVTDLTCQWFVPVMP